MALHTKTPYQEGVSFTSTKVNGEATWLSNMPQHKFRQHNGLVYEKHHVESLRMEYVDDPQIMCAEPIYEWQTKNEKGQWVMKHGLDPTFHITEDVMSYQCVIHITAHIQPKRWTEFCLRWP